MAPMRISASTNYHYASALNTTTMLKKEHYTPSSNGHTLSVSPSTTVTAAAGGTAAENNNAFKFDDMDEALAAFRTGEFLLVMDDEGRENEGDLIIAASAITTEKMAWFIKVTRCVLCASSLLPVWILSPRRAVGSCV